MAVNYSQCFGLCRGHRDPTVRSEKCCKKWIMMHRADVKGTRNRKELSPAFSSTEQKRLPGLPWQSQRLVRERVRFALGTGVSTHYGQGSCSSTASECYRKGKPIPTITDCSNHFWHFSLDYHSINSAPCLACQVALLSIWIGKQPRTPHFKCQISAKSQQHKCNWHPTHRAPSSGHSSTTLPQQRAHTITAQETPWLMPGSYCKLGPHWGS